MSPSPESDKSFSEILSRKPGLKDDFELAQEVQENFLRYEFEPEGEQKKRFYGDACARFATLSTAFHVEPELDEPLDCKFPKKHLPVILMLS